MIKNNIYKKVIILLMMAQLLPLAVHAEEIKSSDSAFSWLSFTDIISNGFKKATTILADASSFVYNEIEATGSLLLGNTKNRFQLDQNTGDHLAHNLDYIIEDDMCKITSSSNMLLQMNSNVRLCRTLGLKKNLLQTKAIILKH